MKTYGSAILEACKKTKNTVILVSPYVNVFALKKIVHALPSEIYIDFISRYLPTDVKSGVCDLDALDLLLARGKCKIYLNPMLHAKFYIFDNIVFSGSANLTGKGLGFSTKSNIEIMTKTSADDPDIKKVHHFLRSTSVELSDSYYAELKKIPVDKANQTQSDQGTDDRIWIPTFKKPLLLWDVYVGTPPQSILGSSLRASERDLQLMDLPLHIPDKDIFYSAVKSIFARSLFFSFIQEKLANSGLSDKDAIEWIASLSTTEIDSPEDSWQAVKEWIRAFFSDNYLIEPESEVLKKGKAIF